MDRVPFFKMSACGNDFCVIDNRDGRFPRPYGPLVRNICKRKIALGADGLIFIERSDSADFTMRYFNSDGGEVQMCGNGARCVARFAFIKGIAPEKMSFNTIAGLINGQVLENGVRIGIGPVKFSVTDSRVSLSDVLHDNEAYYVIVGVPHVVCFMQEDIDAVDVEGLGARIRHHNLFKPDGTNANFVRLIGRSSLKIRTFERGVEAETLACGTGSTASAIVAHGLGLVKPPVEVITQSGSPLEIGFEYEQGIYKDIWLSGEARVVCNGELWLEEIGS